MIHSTRLRAGGLALASVLLAAACGSGSSSAPPGSTASTGPGASPTPTTPPAGSLQITGAGATFPFPLYSKWFYDYAFVNPAVKFNYQSIGSGGGIQQITKKTVDFGASDAILTADQTTAAPGIQMFPTVAGADVLAYNLKALTGKDPLILDGTTVANIFLGKITKWNDPAIASLNPGLTLPDQDIIVVHRSDGSGTTYIFTDYLSKVSDEWKTKVGNATSVNWPVGLGGKGNEGVSGTLTQNDGTIGYVELAYAIANKLAYAKMKNAAGSTVEAKIESTQAAMADFAGQLPDTLAISIVNAPGTASWPIAGYTYLLLYMQQTDCAKGKAIVDFLKWAWGDAGTKDATDLNYVALPDAVKAKDLAKLTQITCNGAPLS
ncbi:MAG: phosphate ABC transporter substrate-binding protein PstS [Candidatus Limnocylindrales bacterium]